MTQFQTQPDIDQIASSFDRRAENLKRNQERIDAMIEQQRASMPPAQLRKLQEKRSQVRLKISEINQMGIDAIKRGVSARDQADHRSPAVRFLDIADLPRNTIANLLFGEPTLGGVAGTTALMTGIGAGVGALVGALGGPAGVVSGALAGAALAGGSQIAAGIARPMVSDERTRAHLAARAQHRGTAGQPSIYFSDALEKMGVESKAARMVLGFTGDVLLDPLTYMGGSNAVTWMSRSGARAILSRAASRNVDDIAAHVVKTGSLPTDPAYRQFIPLWEKSIKIGDEIIDVSGSGPNLRERLFEAAKRINQAATPQSVKAQKRYVAQLLREDLLDTARLNAVNPQLAEKAGLTRGFFSRYTAKSDYALTIPGAGFLANRLRRPLGGRSLDIPVGSMGQAGKLRYELKNADALVSKADNAIELSKRAEQFQAAREATFRAKIAKSLAEAKVDVERAVVAKAVLVDDTPLNRALRQLNKAGKQAELANDSLQSALENGKLLRGADGQEIYTELLDLMDPMDDLMSSMRRGDAATAAMGPSAMMRGMYSGTLKERHNAEIAKRAAMSERDSLERAMVIERNNIRSELDTASGAERDALLDSLNRIEESFEASATAIGKVIESNTKLVEDIEARTFYRLMQKVMDAEQAIRDKFNIGKRGLDQKAIANLRREYERLAPATQERVIRSMRTDFDAALKNNPSFTPDGIHDAWMIVLEDIAHKNAGLRGFARNPVTGEGFDDILDVADNLRKTEVGQQLLADANVRRLAEKHLEYFQNDLRIQQDLGILPDFDPQLLYSHGMLTEKARKAMNELAERIGAKFGGVKGGITTRQAYTYRKVTNRLFYGPDKDDFVYMGELARIKPGKSDHPFEIWRQQHLESHPELRKEGDLWDASNGKQGADGERWIPEDRIFVTSATHLNNHRSDFMRRIGDEFTGDIFEKDLLLTTSRRVLIGERARAVKRFTDEVVKFAKPLSQEEARLLPKGIGGHVVMDGLEYKQLPKPGLNETSLRVPIPDTMRDLYYPVAFADALSDYEKTLGSYSQVNAIIHGADAILTQWKFFTLLHPSWMVTNQVGGAFASATVAKTKPDQWITHGLATLPLILEIHGLKKFSQVADNLPIVLGGMEMTRGEAKELMVQMGIASAGRSTMEVLTAVQVGDKTAGIVDKAAKIKKIMPLLGKWFQLNAAADDQWRAITFLSRMEMGDAPEVAREMMVKAHYDYGDLAAWESKIGVRVAPFYRWMRNNVALQARMFVERPMIAAAFPKLKNALEEAFDAEQLVPEELRPRWVKDNIGVQISSRPEAKFALLSIFTPIQELIETGQMVLGGDGFEEAMKYAVSSSNPLIKAPIELAYGQELFTGREIGDPDMGKMSRLRYLSQQFRPAREAAKVMELAQQDSTNALDYVTRFVFGGRIQHTTDEKLEKGAAFQFGETSRLLRRQIAKAVKEGDQDDAERLSVKLIERYRDMWDAGLFEQVPKELRARFAREAGSAAR